MRINDFFLGLGLPARTTGLEVVDLLAVVEDLASPDVPLLAALESTLETLGLDAATVAKGLGLLGFEGQRAESDVAADHLVSTGLQMSQHPAHGSSRQQLLDGLRDPNRLDGIGLPESWAWGVVAPRWSSEGESLGGCPSLASEDSRPDLFGLAFGNESV